MKYDKEKSQLQYNLWNSTGRLSSGEEHEFLINYKKQFPGQDEVEIAFDVHDGFAVGNYNGREYLMLYPLVSDVEKNQNWKEQIECYIGEDVIAETGLCPHDVAITFGQITSSTLLPLNLQEYDTVVRLDADINLQEALGLINGQIIEKMNKYYPVDIPEIDDLPVNENGKIQGGYLVLRENGGTDYITKPKKVEEIERLENEAFENATLESLSTEIKIREGREMMKRFSDLEFTRKGNSCFVSFKYDGIQMPTKKLPVRQSLSVRQYISQGLDGLLGIGYNGLLKLYDKELKERKMDGSIQQKTNEVNEILTKFKKGTDFTRVSQPSLYQKNSNDSIPQWMVRAKIDGIQEMGREVEPQLNKLINAVTKNGETRPDTLVWDELKHFVAYSQYQDLLQSMGQEQNHGIKR